MSDIQGPEASQGHTKQAVAKLYVGYLRMICDFLELENRQILCKYTDEELAESFNGIGPESFPDWIVSAMDSISPELLPVCLIHDIEWLESDGTRESFHASNGRLRRNGKIVAKSLYGFWNPKRYVVMWKSRAFAKACEKFGWDTWNDYFLASTVEKRNGPPALPTIPQAFRVRG